MEKREKERKRGELKKMEEKNREIQRLMGVQQAEDRFAHELYARNHESIRNDYQVLADTPFQDSNSKLNPEVIKEFCGKMIWLVLEMMESVKKYEEGDPKPMILSAAMTEIFVQLRTLRNKLKEALPNAGPTLARKICEAVKEISSCSLEFLECAIAYGPYADQESSVGRERLPELAEKVKEACQAFLEMPTTNAMAIQASLERAVNGVKGALEEIQNKDAEAGASSTSSAEGKQDEAIVKAAAICVVTDAVRLVEQMIGNVKIWNDRYEPGRVMSTESLLKKFIELGFRIKPISNNLSPLRNVADILFHLDRMKDIADHLESQPSASGFALTATTLNGSIQHLKSVLKDPSPAQVRDADKQSAECQGPK